MLKHILFISCIPALVISLLPNISQASDLEWNQTQAKIELQPGEEEAQAEFVVTNKGAETVRIANIKTSCGCTGSILDQDTIQPGESTTIIGTFKKGNRRGLNHNRLQVFLESQPEPVATLHMIVQIPRLIEIQPPIVYWNRSSAKDARQVSITFDERYISEIDSIEYDSSMLKITQKATSTDKLDYELDIIPVSFEKQIRQSVQIKAKGLDGTIHQDKIQVFVQP